MSSYRQILYHIVFCTKYRKPVIECQHKKELYRYIWGIIKNKNCILYRINGTEDHIHLLSDLHPCICLADYIKDIKVATSVWMKKSGHFPEFTGWSEGYGAFTYAYRDRIMIIKYIKRQEEHHKRQSFREEYIALLKECEIRHEEKYLL